MYRILGGSEVWREPSYLLTPPNLQFGFYAEKIKNKIVNLAMCNPDSYRDEIAVHFTAILAI